MAANTLPRDILKWIQGLDLSYSVKNPKRDFANGFLVAEIFSRYYPDISMHSFDTGSQMARRADNWNQLAKIFARRRVPISRAEAQDIMEAKQGAAAAVLEKMYTFLTKKTLVVPKNVQAQRAKEEQEAVPPFARPTESKLIAEDIGQSPSVVDEVQVARKAQRIMEEQKAARAEQKAKDPSRYQARPAIPRGPAKTMEQSAGQPLVQFREVQVKAIEQNIAVLRASKELSASTAGSEFGGSSFAGAGSSMHATAELGAGGDVGGDDGASAAAAAAVRAVHIGQPSGLGATGMRTGGGGGGRSVMDLLNKCVRERMRDTDEIKHCIDPVKEPMTSYVEQLPNLSVDAATAVMETACERIEELARACLQNPQELWRLFNVLAPAFSLAETTATFGSLIVLFAEVGARMVEMDADLTWSLFADHAMPRVATLIRTFPKKRYDLLRIVYNFARNDVPTHVTVIKSLQDVLADQAIFVHCLTMLIFLEQDFTADLLDLYVYYASLGMTMTSPSLRASSLSMLTVVIAESPDLVLRMLDKLTSLTADGWWEIQSQLLLCSSYLLEHLDRSDVHSLMVYEIVNKVLQRDNGTNVAKIGLSYLAKNLASHPALATVYVDTLLALPPAVQKNLLGPADEVHALVIMGNVVGSYRIVSLPDEWHGLAIARALVARVRADGLGNFAPAHVDIIAAAVRDLAAQPASLADQGTSVEEIDAWAQLLADAKDYLFVALCDEEVVHGAIGALGKLFAGLGERAFDALPTMLGSLRILFPAGPEPCQQAVADWLTTLFNSGAPWSSAIAKVLQSLPDEARESRLINGLVTYVTSNFRE